MEGGEFEGVGGEDGDAVRVVGEEGAVEVGVH